MSRSLSEQLPGRKLVGSPLWDSQRSPLICISSVLSGCSFPPQSVVRAANAARSNKSFPYVLALGNIAVGKGNNFDIPKVFAISTVKSFEDLLRSPLYVDRENSSETAIEFFERVYGGSEFLLSIGFYAHNLLRVDPRLYKNLAMYQNRRGQLLGELIPMLPEAKGRPRLSDEEFAASALREALKRRERNRVRAQRMREAARADAQPT